MREITSKEYNSIKTLIKERLKGVIAKLVPRNSRDILAWIEVTTREKLYRPSESLLKVVAIQSLSGSDLNDLKDSKELVNI